MEECSIDALSVICEYLDGRDCAWLRACSRTLRRKVSAISNAVGKIGAHIIQVYDMRAFDQVIAPRAVDALKYGRAYDWIENILWYRYGFNPYTVDAANDLMDWIICACYSSERFYQDRVSNDIIYCNNSRDYDFYHCHDEKQDANLSCSRADHIAQHFQFIATHFPGFIKTWMLIRFPQQPRFHHLVTNDGGFHRGTCLYVRIDASGFDGMRSIQKNLIRMRNSRPPCEVMIGSGKKRRLVRMPEPPEHPVCQAMRKNETRHESLTVNKRRKYM